MSDTTTMRADELKPGDLVDMENDPHPTMRGEPLWEYEHAEVCYVSDEPDGIWITFESVGGEFRYDPDHIFQALRRDIDPERFEE